MVKTDLVFIKRKYADSHCLYILLFVANLEFQTFFFFYYVSLHCAKLAFLLEIDEFAEDGRI